MRGLMAMPKALSADQIADVAAYYTNANAEFLPLAGGNTEFIDKGRQLARIGDAAKDIQAGNNCNGPDGAGIPPAIPYLAGQEARRPQMAAVAAFYREVRGATDAPRLNNR
jgi:cytochrome c553